MAFSTGMLMYKFFISNDRIFSSFSIFLCYRVFRVLLVLVSMFAPSIFWKKGY